MKDKHYASMDELIAEIASMSEEELAKERAEDGKHLISVDELRAAGALDVPPGWRKSLGPDREPQLWLFKDEDMLPEKQPPTPSEADDDESADEL